MTVNEAGSEVSVAGNQDIITPAGSTITVLDGATNLTVGGQSYTALLGSNISAAINGSGVTAVVNGNADTLTSGVNGETVTIAGSNDTAVLNGQNITATLTSSSTDDNVTVNAQYIAAYLYGMGDFIQINGLNGAITLAGVNNTVNTAGNQITVADGATGAAIQGGGNSDVIGSGVSASIASSGGDSILVSGSNSSLDISDSYANVTVSGSNNVLHSLDGSDNTLTLAGNGNRISAIGTDDVVSVTGQGQFLAADASTITAAAGTTLTLFNTSTAYQASNGNIVNLGANAALTVQGGNNWVNAAGGDIVTFSGYPYGAGNGIGGSGAGNTVTFQQDGYALLSQSTIAFNGNEGAAGIVPIQGQVTGNGNTITATQGATISVTGTGNTINASGAAIALAGPTPAPGAPLAVRGFAFPSYASGDFNSATSTASLAAMQATGANAVEIVFSQYLYDPGLPDQDAYTINASVPQTTAADGTTVPAKTSVSDADLIAQIRQAESDGLQVLLKPHIDPADGTWRALQTPANIPAFFANYQNFIVHYAEIAQETGVQTFSIGCELASLTGQQYLPYWTQIIAAVRQVYSGQLTYASATYEIGTVSFWSQLDIIGTDAYERTSSQLDPTEAELQAGWTQPLPAASNPIYPGTNTQGFYNSSGVAISPIAEYESLAEQYDKPILITEAGYASVNETDLLEGDGSRNSTTYIDYQQQANAYQALLSALEQNNSILPGQSGQWLDGAYLWSWSPNPATVTADDLSVQGKPALNVVQAAYGAAAASAGPVSNTVTGNSNTVSIGDNEALTINGGSNAFTIGIDVSVNITGAGNIVLVASTAQGSAASVVTASGNGNSFTFSRGYGRLEVNASEAGANTDVLRLAAGIDPSQLSVLDDGAGDIILTDGTAGDWIQLDGMVTDPSKGVQQIEFENGEVWTAQPTLSLLSSSRTVATSVNLLGTSGTDKIILSGAGEIYVFEIGSAGELTASVVLSVSSGSLTVDQNTSVIGTGQNLFGTGGHDVFLRTATGQVNVWEFDSAGVLTAALALTNSGAALGVDQATSMIGTGENLFGTGGYDVFLRTATGQVDVWEFNGAGMLTAALALTNSGAALGVDQATSMIGTGENLFGTGGYDVFLRTATGQVNMWEFDGAGALTAAVALTNSGAALGVDQATSMIGTGENLLGTSGHDVFLRTAIGQVDVWEFNGAGMLTAALALTNNGAALGVDQATSMIGTGQNLFGTSGRDVFLRTATGQVNVWEFNGAGVLTAALALTNNGAALGVDQATSMIGTGENLFGTGGYDVFLRTATGHVNMWEFNGAGALTAAVALTNSGAALGVDQATSMIGTGENLFGTGGYDVFLRTATGQVNVWEFDGAGALTAALALTNNGAALGVDQATSMIGTGQNLFGTGGHDVFLRTATGQVNVWEFNGAGALTAALALTNNGAALGVDQATSMIGTGQNLLGTGGHDVFLRTATSQVNVWEFNGVGALTAAMALTNSGAALGVDQGTSIIGTGQDLLGAGGHDVFLRSSSGQLGIWEFSDAGQLLVGANLYSGSTIIGVDTGSAIISTGTDPQNGNRDFTVRAGSGASSTFDLATSAASQASPAAAAFGHSISLIADDAAVSTQTQPATGVTTSVQDDGATVVAGTSANDILGGVGGQSTLIGNGGDDTYLFGSHDISETIQNGLSNNQSASGDLVFTAAITPENLWLDRVDESGSVSSTGSDLRIELLGTNQSVTIAEWFNQQSPAFQLSKINISQAHVQIDSDIPSLLQSMSNYEQQYEVNHPGSSFNPAYVTNGSVSDPIVLAAEAQAWHS